MQKPSLCSLCLCASVVIPVVFALTTISRGQAPSKSAARGKSDAGAPQRTRAQIDALIDRVGRTPPDWFESTPLNYPPTLDLTWPEKPQGPWNKEKNGSPRTLLIPDA